MNNEELFLHIETKTNCQQSISSEFDDVIDLGEGYYAVTKNNKWGCVNFDGSLITPILYDFVYLDEYEYGRFCLICGHDGYFYRNKYNVIKYKGLFDIYHANQLLFCNIENYENLNHPISFLTNFSI